MANNIQFAIAELISVIGVQPDFYTVIGISSVVFSHVIPTKNTKHHKSNHLQKRTININHIKTKCVNGCELFNDRQLFSYWESKKVTSDEKYILNFLQIEKYINKKRRIIIHGMNILLHITMMQSLHRKMD